MLASVVPILVLVIRHLVVGAGAVLGVGAVLSASEGKAPVDLAYVILVERMFGLWSCLTAWLLWRGHSLLCLDGPSITWTLSATDLSSETDNPLHLLHSNFPACVSPRRADHCKPRTMPVRTRYRPNLASVTSSRNTPSGSRMTPATTVSGSPTTGIQLNNSVHLPYR